MNALPEPLTPPDCDLRDFQFMPLDCGRLRDSKLVSHVPPAQCFFAVILWCASWHQIPAASLPDDDIELARLAGFGFVVKEWKKVRAGALYGWIKCADGRLYHPVVAEKARDAWQAKHEQRWKSECARIKKHNQRHETCIPYPTLDEFLSPDYVDPTKGDKRIVSPGTVEGSPDFVPGTFNPRDREGTGKGEGEVKAQELQHNHGGQSRAAGGPNDRAIDVAVLLRSLGVSPMTGQHPAAREFADTGATDDQLRAAVEVARDRKPAPEAISPNYLRPILAEILNPPKPRAPKSPPLHALTDVQLNAEGVRAGVGEARIGETRHEFIARIQTAQAIAQGRVAA
ncbi:DUF1376 domain-containing protein [Cupriavidus campinensis]|uniref:DUF1376 domain-containing protein n=1 Tax=Cupriavidus campinensis TaxID=151783 RepID=UPI0024E22C6B|nr:DUF1376 domain-containing protein [Cupriavidus campinensis]